MTSLYGGRIEGRPGFNPLIYVDLTVPIDSDTDDESYRNRFLFWTEIDDRNGEIRPNIGKARKFYRTLPPAILGAFDYEKDTKELKFFMANNISNPTEITKIKIDKNNFIPVYLRWLEYKKTNIVVN